MLCDELCAAVWAVGIARSLFVKYRLVYLCLCGTTIEIGFDRYLYYRVYGQLQSVPVSARSSKTEEIACSKNSLRGNLQE